MDDWKDLEIDNIPCDFFVNRNYEIDYLITEQPKNKIEGSLITGTWEPVIYEPIDRASIFIHLNNGEKYRYRLKHLESIVVPQDLYDMIYQETIKRGHYKLLRARKDEHQELYIQGHKVVVK